jgi:hypothetical protein
MKKYTDLSPLAVSMLHKINCVISHYYHVCAIVKRDKKYSMLFMNLPLTLRKKVLQVKCLVRISRFLDTTLRKQGLVSVLRCVFSI